MSDGGLLLGLAFLAHAGAFTYFCAAENRADGTFSATTAVAGMATFVLGAAAILVDAGLAAARAVAIAGLLALREGLHGWVARLTFAELRAGLLLTAMTFIALPLLPDRAIGPLAGVNPREIWLIAIVLAAVSFLGYAGAKTFGATRGLLLAAAAGGLVSSIAVMAMSARRAAAGEGTPRLLTAGAILATAISFVRGLGLVAALGWSVLPYVAAPLVAAAVTAGGSALLLSRQSGPDGGQAMEFRNPFEFVPVIGFALLLGIAILVAEALTQRYGATGALIGAVAAGLGDIDAVIVLVVKLVPGSLDAAAAARAVLAAVAANTIAKLVLGVAVARGTFALTVAAATAAVAAIATAAALVAWPLVG